MLRKDAWLRGPGWVAVGVQTYGRLYREREIALCRLRSNLGKHLTSNAHTGEKLKMPGTAGMYTKSKQTVSRVGQNSTTIYLVSLPTW